MDEILPVAKRTRVAARRAASSSQEPRAPRPMLGERLRGPPLRMDEILPVNIGFWGTGFARQLLRQCFSRAAARSCDVQNWQYFVHAPKGICADSGPPFCLTHFAVDMLLRPARARPPSGWTKYCQSTLDSGGRGLQGSCSVNVFLALRRARATCKTGNISSMHRKGFVLTAVPLSASHTLPWTCCCALRARVTPAAGRALHSKLRISGSLARALSWAAGSATRAQ